jgi:hypothetical protein
VPKKKNKKDRGKSILAIVEREMAKPRITASARQAEADPASRIRTAANPYIILAKKKI